MSNSKLNESLVESFGELEKMCNFVFDDLHGVTCYINKLGERDLSKADREILKKLKSVRHKRNKLSHGEVAFSEECAEQEDIDFLEDFMKSITKGSDPLRLYFPQKKTSAPAKKVTAQQEDTETALIGGGIVIVLLIIAVVCVAVSVLGKYIH